MWTYLEFLKVFLCSFMHERPRPANDVLAWRGDGTPTRESGLGSGDVYNYIPCPKGIDFLWALNPKWNGHQSIAVYIAYKGEVRVTGSCRHPEEMWEMLETEMTGISEALLLKFLLKQRLNSVKAVGIEPTYIHVENWKDSLTSHQKWVYNRYYSIIL
jgi:hypothetical protein